ncbi:ribonuclease domain-containing protein [Streptomyces albogriseolus]|uniref:ribonuclease domain-containing protein n=1 Tax=Streptomyces albogriseolus TaxID=1887 RepID=UPI003CF098F1
MGPGEGRQCRPHDAATGPPPASGGEGGPPRRERGHYRACTAPAPGPDDRGARRVVTGRNGGTNGTDDPYASFTAVPR